MALTSGKITKMPKSLSKKVAIVKKPVRPQVPGVNPFKTTPGKAIQKKGGRVTSKEVVMNQIGIHSLEWASKISSNSSRLFSLTTEIRLAIWTEVINGIGWSYDNKILPRKVGNKFGEARSSKFGKVIMGLYTLCRQAYVDIHGSALLYRLKEFEFRSSYQMLNYLSTINPHHRNGIDSITLSCCVSWKDYTLNTRELTWSMLQSMSSLRSLKLEIIVGGPAGFEQFIEKIKVLKGLKGIRGLKEFDMYLGYYSRDDVKKAKLREATNKIRQAVLQAKAA